jgi:hypothetical protein
MFSIIEAWRRATYGRNVDRIASADSGSIILVEGVAFSENPQEEKGQRDRGKIEIHINQRLLRIS